MLVLLYGTTVAASIVIDSNGEAGQSKKQSPDHDREARTKNIMKTSPTVIAGICGVLIFCSGVTQTSAQTVLSNQQATQAVSLENLDLNPQRISGTLINRTPHQLRDVQLAIQYHWLWRNERNPGSNSPGRTVFIRFNEVLEPGRPHRFIYTPEFQLPSRSDGYFMPEVDVAGFTAVIEQRPTALR